jgi:glycosyltransferase involved in cell wall biosynthesis
VNVDKIPITVLIATRNEASRIARCLEALQDFDDIIVIDSSSTDDTKEIARNHGANVVNFTWNGAYPKKRQWILDHVPCKHDRIFFVDADEIVTPELVKEIAACDWSNAGYFVRGRYILNGKLLRHGLHNNKLVLFDRCKIEFPVIDDLDCDGMGEMEGHYQPILKPQHKDNKIGQLKHVMLHEALDDRAAWLRRHERYAQWEAGMNAKNAWTCDPVPFRQYLKVLFRNAPCRPLIAFLHAYILKRGFLDGREGFKFAASRALYYRLVAKANRAQGNNAAACNSPSVPQKSEH